MSEKLDLKQKVLVAFYLEYQKELPEMRYVDADSLETDQNRFCVAVRKLQNEGYVKGAKFVSLNGVLTDFVMLTRDGLQYVEEVLDIKATMSAGEKVKEVGKKATLWGYGELKDIAAKVLGEVISKSMGV